MQPKRIVYKDHPAWRAQWFFILIVALVSLAVLSSLLDSATMTSATPGAGLAFNILYLLLSDLIAAAYVAYRRYVISYTITNDAVACNRGFIGRSQTTIRLSDIRNIKLQQSMLQRLLRTGNVEFSSAAGPSIDTAFIDIHNPQRACDIVRDLQATVAMAHETHESD